MRVRDVLGTAWSVVWKLLAIGSFVLGAALIPYPVIPSNPVTTSISNGFSSYFNPPTQPSVVSAEVNVPWISVPKLNYTSTQPIDIVFSLSGGKLVVGQPLNLTVSLDAPTSLIGLYGSPIVTVGLDSALAYPFTQRVNVLQSCPPLEIDCFLNGYSPTFSRLVFNTTSGIGPWVKSQTIEYTVSGSFGATVHVLPNPFSPEFSVLPVPSLDLPFHTTQLYTISSQDTVLGYRNAQTTLTVSLFTLGVASLQVSRWKPKPRYASMKKGERPSYVT